MALDSKNPKIDFIRMALTLFVITALVAVALAAANYATAPIIEQSAKERLDDSLKTLIAEASTFEEAEEFEKSISFGETKVPVEAIYIAKDASDTHLGYCVRVTPNGYSDVIDMLVAIDKEGAVSGVQILSIADTPGIGMKVESDETFRKSLIGKNELVTAVKTAPDAGEVQVISGATVSSTAYINGVNAAIEAVQKLEQEAAK
ncbi:MAG: FMN-binding protein [Clostridia bacterium]|nr:FMN-binding protein [Clostridia bacterium]